MDQFAQVLGQLANQGTVVLAQSDQVAGQPARAVAAAQQAFDPRTKIDDQVEIRIELARHQTVAAVHELEGAFALADSGIPDNQRPDRKDVDENSVELNPRREVVLQII